MAILSNVAYYCSKINDYETAAKLYGAAFCFAYNNNKLKLKTLQNLDKSYRKMGQQAKARIVENEIFRIEAELNRRPAPMKRLAELVDPFSFIH